MSHIIITISREFGSGGTIIGHLVAKTLNIPFYDRIKIDMLAHKNGLSNQYIKNWQGQPPSSIVWDHKSDSYESFYHNEKRMIQIQSRIIHTVAADGSCVIVGRCADYVLRENTNCLNVRIYASEKSKQTRLYNDYWIRSGNLAQKIIDTDKTRAAYYKRVTGYAWDSLNNYHLILNSDIFGIDGCAALIVAKAKEKSDFYLG